MLCKTQDMLFPLFVCIVYMIMIQTSDGHVGLFSQIILAIHMVLETML